eukprot:COSAG04_NODE_1565_length_6321_cov_5.077306_7_plen_175_part_00
MLAVRVRYSVSGRWRLGWWQQEEGGGGGEGAGHQAARVWAAARGHPRAEQGGLPHAERRQDRGGRRGARVSEGRGGDLRKCTSRILCSRCARPPLAKVFTCRPPRPVQPAATGAPNQRPAHAHQQAGAREMSKPIRRRVDLSHKSQSIFPSSRNRNRLRDHGIISRRRCGAAAL